MKKSPGWLTRFRIWILSGDDEIIVIISLLDLWIWLDCDMKSKTKKLASMKNGQFLTHKKSMGVRFRGCVKINCRKIEMSENWWCAKIEVK